jgi:hypothetical protein
MTADQGIDRSPCSWATEGPKRPLQMKGFRPSDVQVEQRAARLMLDWRTIPKFGDTKL